jgi:serine/threonine protein kinase
MEGDNPERSFVGTVIDGKYEVERLIGRGGMGAVYAARQLQLDRAVAIKVLRAELVADSSAVARFSREARASARLEHAHAVRVYDFGTLEGGSAYIVMELLEGQSLRAMMRRSRLLPVDAILQVMWQAASAVAAAHALGVVHRDLKPENVIVRLADDGALTVKVLDFGLAKLLSGESTQLTHPAEVIGTPKYMAPEQFGEGKTDERLDVYALGVILYELLAGRPPFDGTFGEIVGKHLYAEPPTFASLGLEVPEAVERVVRRALAKDPKERTPSAADLARDLLRAYGLDAPAATSALKPASQTSVLEAMVEGGAPPLDDTELLEPEEYRTQLISRDDEATVVRDHPSMRSGRTVDEDATAGAPRPHSIEIEVEPTEHHAIPDLAPKTRSSGFYVAAALVAATVLGASAAFVWMGLDGSDASEVPVASAPAPEAPPSVATGEPANANALVEGAEDYVTDEELEGPSPATGERAEPPAQPGAIGEQPLFRNGAVILDTAGARVQRGATLGVVRASGGTEWFPVVTNRSGTRLVVRPGARSRPGGLTLEQLVPPGAVFEYLIRQPDGTQSEPAVVNRPKE